MAGPSFNKWQWIDSDRKKRWEVGETSEGGDKKDEERLEARKEKGGDVSPSIEKALTGVTVTVLDLPGKTEAGEIREGVLKRD